MSKDWVADVREMHSKFGVYPVVDRMTYEEVVEYLKFRIKMVEEELVETRDAKDDEGVVDGLIDMTVFVIGTLDLMGVDVHRAWDVVHAANMAKEPGVNPNRPSQWGFPDLVKPDGWRPPSHAGNTGTIGDIWRLTNLNQLPDEQLWDAAMAGALERPRRLAGRYVDHERAIVIDEAIRAHAPRHTGTTVGEYGATANPPETFAAHNTGVVIPGLDTAV
jgi:hypothetical protein